MAIDHPHRLDRLAVGQLEEILDGAVRPGSLPAPRGQHGQRSLLCQAGAQRLGQVGHLVDRPRPLLLNPPEELFGAEGAFPHRSQSCASSGRVIDARSYRILRSSVGPLYGSHHRGEEKAVAAEILIRSKIVRHPAWGSALPTIPPSGRGRKPACSPQKPVDNRLILLGMEGTGAVEQRPAGFQIAGGRLQYTILQRKKSRKIVNVLKNEYPPVCAGGCRAPSRGRRRAPDRPARSRRRPPPSHRRPRGPTAAIPNRAAPPATASSREGIAVERIESGPGPPSARRG